jgi:4-hydroxy-3-methylbut-2-enyl diphosphate reductase
MKVLRAAEMGMCFGVRDALAAARAVAAPEEVTIHGELVHNEEVLAELSGHGFRQRAEHDRAALPATSLVLITAHGVSDAERRRLGDAGKQLIDTTCPLVRFVHESAQRLARDGYFVLVVGKPGHVEVEGLTGDLPRHAVVAEPSDARAYGEPRLGIVCQTTTRPAQAEAVVAAIRAHNPLAEVRFVDTICGPTRNRQIAAEELLGRVEAVVVVGGARSNNTRELVRLAAARGIPARHVQSAADLDREWLSRFAVVGLTAGTSTLDSTIDQVEQAMIAAGVVEPVEAATAALSARAAG